MPYEVLEVQFLMEQVIVLDKITEKSTAGQRCQVLWIHIGYDGVQNLER